MNQSLCSFCGGNTKDEKSEFSVALTSPTGVYGGSDSTTYTYNDVTVKVPRCKNCEIIHNKLNKKYRYIKLIYRLLGNVFGFLALYLSSLLDKFEALEKLSFFIGIRLLDCGLHYV